MSSSPSLFALFLLCFCQLIWPPLLGSALSLPTDNNRICPSKCECQKSSESNEEGDEEEGPIKREEEGMEKEAEGAEAVGLSIRCLRGAINDSEFLSLLQSAVAPMDVRQLEIRGAPTRPNSLHWSDNLNRLSRLRRLALIDSGVPALSQAIRLPLLSELLLAGNGIEQIQLGSFLGMPMLESLDLSRNRISALPTGAFIYLKNLRSLSLSHNRLGPDLTTGNLLHGPRQLKSLQLDGNKLSSKQLNDLFPDLSALERLELNQCGLNDAELWSLNLSAVSALRRIGLAGNNLTQVPSTSLRALAHVDTLDLGDNLIRSLDPCSFCGLNISRVFLRRNLLGLSARPIHREAFADTRMLELDLGWNHFRQFDSSILAGAQESLEILHLSGNPVEMDGPLMRTLPRLKELHLADCSLGTVPYSLPKCFQQLTLLNLSSNGLDHLPPNLGTFLPQLRVLDISHNRFTSLPHALLPFIERLSLVFLHHNPWDCQCAAQPLQLHMLQRLAYRDQLRFDETICAEPPLLRNQSLHRVQKINDCAVFFGANFGITQNTELVLILAALLVAAFLFSLVLIFLLYCGRENKQKGSYVTGEQRRGRQMMAAKGGDSGNGKMVGTNENGGGGEEEEEDGGEAALTMMMAKGGRAGMLGLDLSPAPLLVSSSSATNSSLVSSGHHTPPPAANLLLISPLTVQGLALKSGQCERRPLLCPPPLDSNQNCIMPGQLVVQSQGPRHPLPPSRQPTKTLLTF